MNPCFSWSRVWRASYLPSKIRCKALVKKSWFIQIADASNNFFSSGSLTAEKFIFFFGRLDLKRPLTYRLPIQPRLINHQPSFESMIAKPHSLTPSKTNRVNMYAYVTSIKDFNCKGWPALMGDSLLWQPATVPLLIECICTVLFLLGK